MEFNFNTFFGYEDKINALKDMVLIYGFATIIFGSVAILIIGTITRKLGLVYINSKIISPLILCLGLTLLVAILPTIVFYVVAYDISGVKLLYSWITIFVGMTLFVIFNLKTIKSVFHGFGMVSEQEEFRNRRRK